MYLFVAVCEVISKALGSCDNALSTDHKDVIALFEFHIFGTKMFSVCVQIIIAFSNNNDFQPFFC